MRVTRRQLRRIIREEKIRLLIEEETAEENPEKKAAFEELSSAIESAFKAASEAGLTAEEVGQVTQGIGKDHGIG
tara:strand:+ start:364 stop:588 length:225 start_codon:yes stop_codon:yes gene_type:complete